MKKSVFTANYSIVVLSIVFTSFLSNCKINHANTKQIEYLEGLYQSEKMPADIGSPYRLFLKFQKNGTVISMNSSLESDSINKLIDANFSETGRYTIRNKDSISFKFTNNRINNNEYTSTYKGKIAKGKVLKLKSTIQYKGSKPYDVVNSYTLCP